MTLTADYELEDALQSARKAGRDKVLDELKDWATTGFNKDVVKIPGKSLLFKLAELRQAGEP
jgi:hypothetical protein